MDDLIERQAAIDALNTYEDVVDTASQVFTIRGCKEAITNLPSAQPKPQWIPCSERLPDVGHRVLLSGHGQVMVGMLHSSGKYSLEPTGISRVYPKDDIDAWMPLPEAYQEGEQNE